MDTDFIAAIVVALVGGFIGWAEKRMSKVKRSNSDVQQRQSNQLRSRQSQPRPQHQPQPRPFIPVDENTGSLDVYVPESTVAEPLVRQRQPLHESLASETDCGETEAVTPVRNDAPVEPLSRNKLREAIIWGEILKRKF